MWNFSGNVVDVRMDLFSSKCQNRDGFFCRTEVLGRGGGGTKGRVEGLIRCDYINRMKKRHR